MNCYSFDKIADPAFIGIGLECCQAARNKYCNPRLCLVAAQRIVTRESSCADTSVPRPEQEYFPTRTVEIERKAPAAVTTSRSANIMERKRIARNLLSPGSPVVISTNF